MTKRFLAAPANASSAQIKTYAEMLKRGGSLNPAFVLLLPWMDLARHRSQTRSAQISSGPHRRPSLLRRSFAVALKAMATCVAALASMARRPPWTPASATAEWRMDPDGLALRRMPMRLIDGRR